MPVTRTTASLSTLLRVSALNTREHSEADIDSCAATIRVSGILHPLLVQYAADIDGYEVHAGGKRWRSAKKLEAEGFAIDEVDVLLFEGSDAQLIEAILAIENEVTPQHPVDMFELFARLQDEHGFDVDKLARNFGRTTRDVRGILALAHMAPGVRQAWREGRITREIAQAFAASGASHAQQEDLLARLQDDCDQWNPTIADCTDAQDIRRELRGDTLRGDSAEALFVGREAYIAAGGEIAEDLFTSADEVLFRQGTLLKRLAQEKLMREAERIGAAEGWGIVATDTSDLRWRARHADLMDDERARIEQIDTELCDDETDDAAVESLEREAREIETRAALRAIPAGERANLAVAVLLHNDGAIEIARGLQPIDRAPRAQAGATDTLSRPTDRGGVPGDAGEGRDDEDGDDDAAPASATPAQLSTGLRDVVDETLKAAFAQTVAGDVFMALALAVAAMGGGHGARAAGLEIDGAGEAIAFKHPLLREIDRAAFADALAICIAQDFPSLQAAFSECVAHSFNPGGRRIEALAPVFAALRPAGENADLAVLRALDDAITGTFDAAAWFAASDKAGIVQAIRAIDGEAAGAAAAKMKKPQAAAVAAKLARDRRWLPAQLADFAGRAAPPAPVDPTLAQAMADAIEADETRARALHARVFAWMKARYAGAGAPGARLDKLINAHRQYQADEDTICSEADFRTALTTDGFEVRDFRGKPWIFAAKAAAIVGEDA